MPGIGFKRPAEIERMLAKATSDHDRMIQDVASKKASYEASGKTNQKDLERKWHDALRVYRENERLRWWLILSKREPRYYKVIRAGDIDDDTESKSYRDFKQKWRVVDLVRGQWFLERKDDNPHEGMTPEMIETLKHEEAELAAERAQKGIFTPIEAKKGESSARNKRYRLMKKAKEFYDAFWEEVMAKGSADSKASWNLACDTICRKYGLTEILLNPTEKGNLDFYAEYFEAKKKEDAKKKTKAKDRT